MIKGIIFDIDDTLYSHKIKAVPSLTLKALDKLRDKGIKIGVCTSRVIKEMNDIPQELWDRIDCKIMGTGAITLIEDKYYKGYCLDHEDVKKYISIFERNNMNYHYSDINGDLFYCGDKELVNSGQTLRLTNGQVMFKRWEDEDITNLFYYGASDQIEEEIESINGNTIISHWGDCGNICASYVDKGFGVLKFCQMYGFTTDEVAAAGDGANDDMMLQMAGIGIAVKNAKENTKKVADYICKKSIEDGGLYQALVDLQIIDEDKYNCKIFFFDIDCTTYDHNIGDVREKTYLALEKLKQKGYKICVNTSRSIQEMYNIPKRYIDLFDCISTLAGSYIVKDGQVVVECLDQKSSEIIAKYFDDNNITYRYCLPDGTGFINHHHYEKEQLFKRLYDMIPPIKPYNHEELTQFLFYDTGEVRDKLIKMNLPVDIAIAHYGGEIYPMGVNKGLVMEKIAKMYGYSLEETCAFGDGDNDVVMLDMANLGICMGNGTDNLKQHADYITDDISDEGLYNALVHFGFID